MVDYWDTLKVNKTIVEVDYLLQNIINKFPDKIINTSLPNIRIEADPKLLNQLLTNLITNAIQAQATKVTITCTGNSVVVSDNGIGIPKEIKDDIFLTGFSTKGEGRGLGLSLVKAIVDKHRWRIRVTGRNKFIILL